jgi:hypothetical protein
VSWRRSRAKRLIVTVICAGVVSGTAYAYTAANTVSSSNVGSGSGTINGYSLSGLAYTLNANDPRNVDQVSFTLSPTNAQTVKAQLAASSSWYTCTNSSGSVTCTTTSPQATAAGSTQLTVVSAQ